MKMLIVSLAILVSSITYAQPCTRKGLPPNQICVWGIGYSRGKYNCKPAILDAQKKILDEAAKFCHGKVLLVRWEMFDCDTPKMNHNPLDYTYAAESGIFQCSL